MKAVILSTTILLEEGEFTMKSLSLAAARAWVAAHNPQNFCGHQTVKILGLEPDSSRAECTGYDQALCLKPSVRLEFGREYSVEEIELIGVQFSLITKVE